MGVWKFIRRGWAGFAHYVRYEIDNGSKVLFWHFVWCGEPPLKVLFPELFTIACGKECGWRRICSLIMVPFVGISCLLFFFFF